MHVCTAPIVSLLCITDHDHPASHCMILDSRSQHFSWSSLLEGQPSDISVSSHDLLTLVLMLRRDLTLLQDRHYGHPPSILMPERSLIHGAHLRYVCRPVLACYRIYSPSSRPACLSLVSIRDSCLHFAHQVYAHEYTSTRAVLYFSLLGKLFHEVFGSNAHSHLCFYPIVVLNPSTSLDCCPSSTQVEFNVGLSSMRRHSAYCSKLYPGFTCSHMSCL